MRFKISTLHMPYTREFVKVCLFLVHFDMAVKMRVQGYIRIMFGTHLLKELLERYNLISLCCNSVNQVHEM